MGAFATLGDYSSRYGEPEDPGRVEALLGDACAMLVAEYERHWGEPYLEGARRAFERSKAAVACSVVNKALSVPAGMQGATQYSQTAGSYSASVTFTNPTGDLFLGSADRRRLGLAGGRAGFAGVWREPDTW